MHAAAVANTELARLANLVEIYCSRSRGLLVFSAISDGTKS